MTLCGQNDQNDNIVSLKDIATTLIEKNNECKRKENENLCLSERSDFNSLDDYDDGNDDEDDDDDGYILSSRRWLVLSAYCLLTSSAGASWLCFPAVSNIIRKYYSISILSVNLLSIEFGVAIIIASLPFAFILEKCGLSKTLKLSALLNLIGACIRYSGFDPNNGYWFLLFGNLFTALSVSGFLFLPGKIASCWFGINEIGKATSICIAFDALGSGLGFLHATLMIRNDNDPNMIENDIKWFVISQLIFAFSVFVFVLIVVKDKPKVPPNPLVVQQEEEIKEYHLKKQSSLESVCDIRYSTFRSFLWKLMKNKNFNLIIHLQGITASVEGIYEMLLNEMLTDLFPGYEKSIGIVGFAAVIFGFITNIVAGMIMDRSSSNKLLTFIVFLLTTLCCLIWTILMEYVASFVALAAVFCLLMSISTSYYTIAFVHSAQITGPMSQVAVGVLLVLTSQIYDSVVSFAVTEVLEIFGSLVVNFVAIGISMFAVILSMFLDSHGNSESILAVSSQV